MTDAAVAAKPSREQLARGLMPKPPPGPAWLYRFVLPMSHAIFWETLAILVPFDPHGVWLPLLVYVSMSASIVVITGYWRVWTFWLAPAKPAPSWVLLLDSIAVVAMLTLVTATVLAWLLTGGHVDIKGSVPDGDAFNTAQAACIWNLLDAIPSLKVPETINWKELTHPFTDHLSGSIILA